MLDNTLKPYQELGARFLAGKRRAGLFDDMGLGKSAQTIRALDLRQAHRGMIVCPASVRQAWVNEFAKFGHISRSVIKGVSIHDFRYWQRGGKDVLIVSYEMAARWAKLIADDCTTMDFLVLDESHYLKSGGAVRTQQILGKEAAGDGLTQWADACWYLTGTPIPNDPIDIHTFLYSSGACDLDRNAFRKEFFISHPRTYGAAHEVKKDKEDELREMIARVSLRRTLSDTEWELPPIFITDTQIDGDTSAVAEMLRQHPGLDKIIMQVLESGRGLSGLTMETAGHVATLRRLIGEAKALPYAKMLLEELNNGLDKIVVFGIHKNAIAIAKGYLESQGIRCVSVTGDIRENERVDNMKEFQGDTACRVFFGNIRAAGVGLTLTAANRIDMMESDWTPAGNAQAIKRIHRIGQHRTSRARFITLANSFDEVVNQIVAEKTARIAAIDEAGGQYAKPDNP